MWLFLAFLAVPLIEIALFIQVGGFIGLWSTLGIVVLTAVLGTYLVRSQGAAAIADLRGRFQTLSDPSRALAHGAMILFAGALLLTPGFFTDGVGFALLMPPVREVLIRYLSSRVKVQSFDMGVNINQRPAREDVVDAEYSEIDPSKPGTPGNSGWTKH